MSNCCKYKLREISRLLSHADLHAKKLSRTFHQVTHLLCNTTKKGSYVSFWNVPEHFANIYKDSLM